MLRLLILLLLVTLPFAPAQAADPPDDMTKLGNHPELTRAIATTKYHLVLKHPVVEERLRELAGPHYDRLTKFGTVDPVGYQPSFNLVLTGMTIDTMDRPVEQRDLVMIVVDWTTGRSWAALQSRTETLVFAPRPSINELPRALRLFVRREAVNNASLDPADSGPSENWIRILNYAEKQPQVWPEK